MTANEFIRVLNNAGADIPSVVWLALRRENDAMVVSWPADASQYALQTASEAGEPGEFVQSAKTIESGQTPVRMAATTGARFFRLTNASVISTQSKLP